MAQKTPEQQRAQKAAAAIATASTAIVAANATADATGAAGKTTKQAAQQALKAFKAALFSGLSAFIAISDQAFANSIKQAGTARGATASEIEKAISAELTFENTFTANAKARVDRDIARILKLPADKRDAAMKKVTDREHRYADMRTRAMATRAFAAIDREVLKRESPRGGFWELDPNVKEHTAGCLFMGGKFWPWSVLDRVHPPRHHGCPCKIRGEDEATTAGHTFSIMDEEVALTVSRDIEMEFGNSSELAEAFGFGHSLGRGFDIHFNEKLHPRGQGGRFTDKPDAPQGSNADKQRTGSAPSGGGGKKSEPEKDPAKVEAKKGDKTPATKQSPRGKAKQDTGADDPLVKARTEQSADVTRGMFNKNERSSKKLRQKSSDLDEVLAEGEKVLPEFKELHKELAEYLGAENGYPGMDYAKGTVDKAKAYVGPGPLKGRKRAAEKVNGKKYSGDASRLGDVVRSSIVMPSVGDIATAVDAMRTIAGKKGWKIHKPENRFAKDDDPAYTNIGPTPVGYRDVAIQLVSPSGHVTEVQFHTHGMLSLKEAGMEGHRPGHTIYEEQRTLMEKDGPLTALEEAKLNRLQEEAKALYGQWNGWS